MKTGNTPCRAICLTRRKDASMEPGHEDREYYAAHDDRVDAMSASMEPGHEDREYAPRACAAAAYFSGLNGARS